MTLLIIDEPALNDNEKIEYASNFKRFIALTIDTLIIFTITLPLEYFNITEYKNLKVLLLISIFTVAYKPFFEYKFGATPGKKLMGLKVISHEYSKLKLSRATFRNIFFVIPTLLSTLITVFIYNQPQFLTVHSFLEYLRILTSSKSLSFINQIVILLNFLDVLSIIFDKKNRSIHDFIAGTIVVKA